MNNLYSNLYEVVLVGLRTLPCIIAVAKFMWPVKF